MTSYVNNHTNESNLRGYQHFWVNHTTEYVNELFPQINTNNIERGWRSLKTYISHQKRSLEANILEEYINTFILISNTNPSIFYQIFMTILKTYLNTN